MHIEVSEDYITGSIIALDRMSCITMFLTWEEISLRNVSWSQGFYIHRAPLLRILVGFARNVLLKLGERKAAFLHLCKKATLLNMTTFLGI